VGIGNIAVAMLPRYGGYDGYREDPVLKVGRRRYIVIPSVTAPWRR
jgi:hypothetical protein